MNRALLLPVAAACILGACTPHKSVPPPASSGRCEVDINSSTLFSNVGSGATARVVQGPADLIGGQYAQGQVGDVLIQNDRIRAIIQQPGRFINPVLFGGVLIDADVQRAKGERGHDQFGRMGPLYAFGRTVNVSKVEVLNDGSAGGPAVVAATGQDSLNNYMHISLVLSQYTGGISSLAINPDTALPLLVTTYYVLSPGENRVRMLSAYCNQGHDPIVIPVGDLTDVGGTLDYFNPQACSHVMGNRNCTADPAPWYALQGNDDVAYGVRQYKFDDPTQPDTAAIISVVGIVGTVAGAQNENGILSWLDTQAQTRPGSFGMHAGEQRLFLRDFFVAHSVGDISSTLTDLNPSGHARLELTVTNADASPAAGAHVAVTDPGSGNEVTMVIADAHGLATLDLPTASYALSAATPGHAILPAKTLQLPSSGTVQQSLQIGPAHALTVQVQDGAGAALPAKVTLICPGGSCPQSVDSYRPFWDTELFPTNVADIQFVPPQGTITFSVAPGQYQVVVTHGPEYSTFPDTWPNQGYAVDLTASDVTVNAVLGHVVNTDGWMSADLHVHAVDSSDSSVVNERRVLGFAAEGVDILCSTDHDYVTDYGPVIRALQADAFVASMIGEELSTFDFGHYNLYPLTLNAANPVNGGAFDWGGQDNDHAMLLADIFSGVRQKSPDTVIQINHGRGTTGVLTKLQVDTGTGATHVDPALFRIVPPAGSTPTDTKLFNDHFDAIEVQNGLTASTSLLNDWMTFISRGVMTTATAVSDTHQTLMYAGGDSRTYVRMGMDSPLQFDPSVFSQALKGHHAIGTNAPFVQVAATRLDANGKALGPTVGIGDTISISPAAKEQLNLNVDVQAPEWVNFDSIELYTYAPGREAFNGKDNSDWPDSRILQRQTLNLATLPIEAVPGPGPQVFRRIHLNTNFVVSPTADTWYVVMVRGSPAANSLFPMVMHGASCNGSVCTASSAQAFAFTNPIFVDGDGDGAYDHFPLSGAAPLPPPPPAPPPGPHRKGPTAKEALDQILYDVRYHHCGG